MDITPDHYARFTDGFSRTVAEELAAIEVDTLILGPTMDGARPKPAARLRSALVERCQEYGAAIKGEHRSLQMAARKAARAGHNLCIHERDLARDCDLIIILPASPGSFAELGMFALDLKIAPKSVIFFDRQYKNAKSFLRYGPRKAFGQLKAAIHDVDYRNINGVWKIVETEIQRAKYRKRIEAS